MALGHSNKDIANALELSVKTVEVHKANAMRKLASRAHRRRPVRPPAGLAPAIPKGFSAGNIRVLPDALAQKGWH